MATSIDLSFDRLLAKWYLPLLVLLCLFTVTHYLRVSTLLAQGWSGWAIGDWLINYETGLTRRGLAGAIISYIARVFELQLNWIVLSIQALTLLGFVGLFINMLRAKVLIFWYVVACCSPGFFLLFTYYDGMAIGRKEVLLYLTFISWLYVCAANTHSTVKTLTFSIIFFCLTLAHEAFFFYAPYFCMAAWLADGPVNKRLPLALMLSSFAAVLLTFFLFKTADPTASCNGLIALGALPEVCVGILSAGPPDPVLLARYYFDTFDRAALLNLFVIFAVVLLPAYLIVQSSSVKKVNKYRCLGGIFLLICFSFPLFVFAIDWGRWISMHVTLSTLMLLLILPNKAEKNQLTQEQLVQHHTGLTAKAFTLLFSALFFVLFTLTYSLGHCCARDFFRPFGPLDKIQNTSVFQKILVPAVE
jgi:hypothetical protein